MGNFIQPPKLTEADVVAIVAPSGLVEEEYLDKAAYILRSWGLEVIFGENLFMQYHQFAGKDTQRLCDLQWALDSDDIKAVFCARGGYGAMRIVDQVHWHQFKENPKWLAGFSDVTVLHSAIQKMGVQSMHSIMPINMGNLSLKAESLSQLKSALFDGELSYTISPNTLNRTGTEKAEIIGGNLSLLYALIGTPYENDWNGKILFIEDVGEHYYHIDRMMQSLKLTGKLDKLSGLIVGGMTEMTDNKRPFGKTPYEIIAETVRDYDYPVAFDFPAGHQNNNQPLMLGAEVSMEVSNKSVSIKM